MKKWAVLAAGVMLQTILGGVYAWSEFVPALTGEYGFSNAQCGLVFGVTIAVFTLCMVPAGRMLDRVGPRITAGFGAVLFAAGYVVAALSGGNYIVVLIGIGGLTGAGIGAGYVCPLTVGMKWFPNNKGLVTGVSVAGFGGGAIVLSYLVKYLLHELEWNVLEVFGLVGICFGGLAFIAALILSEPDEANGDEGKDSASSEGIKQHVFSMPFILLTVGMLGGTFAGLLTVGNLKPILLGSGFDGDTATLGISVFALGNALGRVIWGQLHDRLGARATIVLSLASLGLAIIPLAIGLPEVWVLVAVGVAGTGFGSCFVVYASSMVDYYGADLFPHLYPICFLGYGLAGITGPAIGGWIEDATGTFTWAIMLSITIVFVCVTVLSIGFIRVAAPEEFQE